MEFVDLKSQYRALKREIDARIQRVLDHRSEEHTSELQSQSNIVCRLLLEKKKPDHSTLTIMCDMLAHSCKIHCFVKYTFYFQWFLITCTIIIILRLRAV